jgi:uncharacterized coiled-coil protein SlyX
LLLLKRVDPNPNTLQLFFFLSFFERHFNFVLSPDAANSQNLGATRSQSISDLSSRQDSQESAINNISDIVSEIEQTIVEVQKSITTLHKTSSSLEHQITSISNSQSKYDLKFHQILESLKSLERGALSANSQSSFSSTDHPAPNTINQSSASFPTASPSRPVAPSPFSCTKRPRIDPEDHLFSITTWLHAVPDKNKLEYDVTTLTGIARQEWRLRVRSSTTTPTLQDFREWFIPRFSIFNIAEKTRRHLRNLAQFGKYRHLDSYCSVYINAQAQLGGGHDDELISGFISGLRNQSAIIFNLVLHLLSQRPSKSLACELFLLRRLSASIS